MSSMLSCSVLLFIIQFHGHIALILYNLLCSIKIDRFRCNIFILSFSNIMFHVNKLYLKKYQSQGKAIFGRNTLDHYCMNATENQMIYRTDVLSSVWNYC